MSEQCVFYTTYNTVTGEIRGSGSCPSTAVAQQAYEGESVLQVESNTAEHYVDVSVNPHVVANLLPMSAIVTGAVISGLPPNTTVSGPGVYGLVTDGEADLSDLLPGSYQITCRAPTYLETIYEVIQP